jgi:hypothetical protein
MNEKHKKRQKEKGTVQPYICVEAPYGVSYHSRHKYKYGFKTHCFLKDVILYVKSLNEKIL